MSRSWRETLRRTKKRFFSRLGFKERKAPDRNKYDLMYSLQRHYPYSRIIPWRVLGPNEQLIDAIDTMNINPPMQVLDLGCGSGKNAKYLLKKGFDVIGLDFSFEALKLAREHNVECSLILGDASLLPFEGDVFDFVFDMGCLHCVPPNNRERFRDGIVRVLKTEGLYFLRAWFSSMEDLQIQKPMFYLFRGKVPIWGFNSSIISCLYSNHFKIDYARKEIDEDNYGPFLIYLMSKI